MAFNTVFLIKVFLLKLCVAVVFGHPIGQILKKKSLPFQDCGSEYDIIDLNIASCEDLPCEMELGTTVLVQTIFDDYGKDTKYLKHTVSWIFNSVRTDAHITPDPCDGKDECLANETDAKIYWASVFVNETLPVLRGVMMWETHDELNDQVMCYQVPVKITYT